jgi:predicted regulator of Ras-like GTPase activity (Roadblock/LC7/MglB family)
MNPDHISLFKAEYQKLKSILGKIQKDLRAHLVMLINRSGHQIASVGPAQDLDSTALASLAAANVAATNGLAQLVGEQGFTVLHHQGSCRSIHISTIGDRFSIVIVFYEPVAVGLVRWKLKRTTAALEDLFRDFAAHQELSESSPEGGAERPSLFSDDEIERLLGN